MTLCRRPVINIGRYSAWLFVIFILAFALNAHAAELNLNTKKDLETIASLASKGQWANARKVVNSSADKQLLSQSLAALQIYLEPETYTTKELIKFFDSEKWLPFSALASKIESSMNFERSPKEVISWYEKFPPQTSFGKFMYYYVLFMHSADNQINDEDRLSFINTWLLSRLDAKEERDVMTKFKSIITVKDTLKKIEHYTWNDNFSQANNLISLLPAKYTDEAKQRVNLAKNPQLLKNFLNNSQSFKTSDEYIQFLAVKFLSDKSHDEHALKLISYVKSSVHSPKWFVLRNYLTRYAISEGRYEEAYSVIANHSLQNGSDYVEAEFLAGFLALRFLNKQQDALEHFKKMASEASHSTSKAKAHYFLAQTFKSLGQPQYYNQQLELAAKYRATFYGQISLAELNNSAVDLNLIGDEPSSKRIESEKITAITNLTLFANAAYKAKLTNLSKSLIESIVELHPNQENILLAINYLKKSGANSLAIQLSDNAAKRHGLIFVHGYPSDLPSVVNQQRKSLYLGIIRQESNFDQSSKSNRGAVGLMQLMPETAFKMAKKLGLPKHAYASDAKANVLKGSAYFDELLRSFNNSYMLAVCAYNAGPTNVRRWVKKYGDPSTMDLDGIIDWIEMIPFSQTRLYVKKVLENAIIYDNIHAKNNKSHLITKYLINE
jgi:soluble lytic murein transglycosylase